MRRLVRVKLYNHPVLKNSEFNLIDKDDIFSKHHFSLLIGQNGTGKSKLLEAISFILIFLDRNIKKEKFKSDWDFGFELEFRKSKERFIIKKDTSSDSFSEDEINQIKQYLPDNIIISAYTFNDKYPKLDDDYEFLRYCGLRTVSNNIFVNKPTEDCFNNLTEIIRDNNKLKAINPIFDELGLNRTILVKYESGKKKGILDKSEVKRILSRVKANEKVDELDITKFSEVIEEITKINQKKKGDRFQDTSIRRFLKHPENIQNVLIYLSNNNLLVNSKRSTKVEKEFKFHWCEDLKDIEKKENNDFLAHLDIFKHLKEIEIIKFESFQVKREGYYSFEDASSGEFHFLHLTSSILRNLKKNSIVLIDEPEISLHPNWQNKLIFTLTPIFKLFPDSQFICSSHSHLLVSSLEKSNSSIITIRRDGDDLIINNLEKLDTYGWSAEQILFDVFQMSTDRNYYLTLKVQTIIDKMTSTNPNIKEIEALKRELKELKLENLHKDDPFNIMLKKLLK